MKELKQAVCASWHLVCKACGTAYSTVMRWLGRYDSGRELVVVPGPRKAVRLDREFLSAAFVNLSHGPKRTRGSGVLFALVKDEISRRDFQRLVEQARRAHRKQRREAIKHIEWLCPGAVWAIDDTLLARDGRYRKFYLNTVYDVAARFTLNSLKGDFATGPYIAAHLDHLFEVHGAPLILKRDNHSNLNHPAIERVLIEHGVIALNSPPYFPRYNGGIEREQREIKSMLWSLVGEQRITQGVIEEHTDMAIHVLNHRNRPVLQGLSPCDCFRPENRRTFTWRDRCAMIAKVADKAQAIYRRLKDFTKRGRATAYRLAVESCMKEWQLISVTCNG